MALTHEMMMSSLRIAEFQLTQLQDNLKQMKKILVEESGPTLSAAQPILLSNPEATPQALSPEALARKEAQSKRMKESWAQRKKAAKTVATKKVATKKAR
jgi:hypothetical protein